MSKFYGQVVGERQAATRTGHHHIKTSAQSYDGSVITELTYEDDKLMVTICVADCSSAYGQRMFYGTYEDFVAKLRG